ncbi:MAG: hypothetical protein ABIY36_01390, partial [Candidatus Limnocylindria bacterium]
GQAAMPAHADGEVRIGDRVHSGRQEWNLKTESGKIHAEIDLRRIGRHRSGYEGDLLESVSTA